MQAIFFDLDNTLYDVEQYFTAAFMEVSKYLSKKHKLKENEIYEKLMEKWKSKTSMYPKLFNDVLDSLGIKNELDAVVNIFNNHEVELKPYSDVISSLKKLKEKGFKIGIISDGNVKRQKRKINSLGIKDYFDVMVFTNEIKESKSSDIPFKKAISNLKEPVKKAFYIGDNPHLDFKGAKEAGMITIRILKGEFKDMPSDEFIDYEINKISEIIRMVTE